MRGRGIAGCLLVVACLSFCLVVPLRAYLHAQEQTPAQGQAAPERDKSIGGEVAQESREAAGEEENGELKHSHAVQWLARVTGMSVHQTHLVAIGLNFAIIAFLIYWFGRKSVPQMLKSRNESIQKALEEARGASQEANRRLAEIENRLRQLDVEIGQMQAAAEKEGEAEEVRIRKATEEDLHKVVLSAEQEIVAAGKQARRELTAHTADLAIALATKQIQVDPATDQTLVRTFAGQLSSGSGGKDGN